MIMPLLHMGACCLMHVQSHVSALNNMLDYELTHRAGPFTARNAYQL